MFVQSRPLFPFVALAAACSTLLAGCSGGSSKAKPAKKAEQSVYTSTADCADAGKITIDECIDAIEPAISAHIKKSPVYKSLKRCEKAEGADRCERDAGDSYRPKLRAFLVTFGAKRTIAAPLYATKDGTSGFRKLDKSVVSGHNEDINFSSQAIAAYSQYGEKKKKKKMF